MRFECARQAWHDAFDSCAATFDYEAIGGKSTASASTGRRGKTLIRGDEGRVICRIDAPRVRAVETPRERDSGNRIMDACEKGMIQSVVARLRRSDPLAYCWGMAAYAPPANRVRERAHLLHHMMECSSTWNEPHAPLKVGQLALFCIYACARRDVNGKRIDLSQARTILRCDRSEWIGTWRKIWVRLVRLLDPLPARALIPVDRVVQEYRERLQPAS